MIEQAFFMLQSNKHIFPKGFKMKVENLQDDTLELLVVKAPAQEK